MTVLPSAPHSCHFGVPQAMVWKCFTLTYFLTSNDLWPWRSNWGQKVGQSKTFSNHGLWRTKMTGMKSRMQNCHSWLSNWSCFWDISYFVFSLCNSMGPDPWKWQSSMSIISILDPFQLFYGESIYSVTWCIYTMW